MVLAHDEICKRREVDAELGAMFHAGTRDDVIEAKERRSRPHGALAIGRAVINKFRRSLARVFPQGFDANK